MTNGWGALISFYYFPIVLGHFILSSINMLFKEKKTKSLGFTYLAIFMAMFMGLSYMLYLDYLDTMSLLYVIFVLLFFLVPQLVGYLLSRKVPFFAYLSLPVVVALGIVYIILGLVSGKSID